jgi:predicted  nucleic acid-binding Zn-ribbon protein
MTSQKHWSNTAQTPYSLETLEALLPEGVKEVLEKELELERKRCNRGVDLLEQEIREQKGFLDQWLIVPDLSDQEQRIDVSRWVAELKGKSEELSERLGEVNEQIAEKRKKLTKLSGELKDLFDRLKGVRADLDKTNQQIAALEQAQQEMDEKTPPVQVQLVEQQLEAACAYAASLEEMLPDNKEGVFYSAIQEQLGNWQRARAALLKLHVGPNGDCAVKAEGGQDFDNKVGLEIWMKELGVQINYLERYQDYLEAQEIPAEEKSTRPDPSQPTSQVAQQYLHAEGPAQVAT